MIDPEQPHSAIYTVKLDCDNWTLSCYRGWTMIKQDSIEPSKYFFGINARSYNDTKITIIDPIRIQYNFESQFCAIEDELY